jgi:hypothetical protein
MDYMVARARRLASDVAGGDHRIKAEDGYDPRCPRWCRRLASVQYVRSGMVRGSWELDRAWRWRRAGCGPCSATQMLLPSSLCRGAAVIGITKLAPRMRARETGRSPPSSTGPPAAVPEWLRRFDVHARPDPPLARYDVDQCEPVCSKVLCCDDSRQVAPRPCPRCCDDGIIGRRAHSTSPVIAHPKNTSTNALDEAVPLDELARQ